MAKFAICKHCGVAVGFVIDKNVSLTCCGEKMTELTPNTVDAAQEKHLPVVNVSGTTVKITVGSVAHPMTEEHNITFIYLETKNGGQMKRLNPNDEPTVTFALADDTPVAAYAYCNLHGLWKTDI
ncbi:MAG: desulfoferrodoxin [Defluviitaleaceae bacterium]|nr:desulfoferrodoxin [Defluviitaleaceae bacterium]